MGSDFIAQGMAGKALQDINSKASLHGDNTFAGVNTFNANVKLPTIVDSTTTFSDMVVEADGSLRKKPSLSILGDVLSIESTPPTLTGGGARYLVAAAGNTGVFVGNENKIATDNGASFGFYTPVTGDITSLPDGTTYRFSGTAWALYVVHVSGGNIMQSISTSATVTAFQIPTLQRSVLVNVALNGGVFTVPVASASNAGQLLEIKRTDNTANSLRIIPSAGQTIDGQTPAGGVYLFSQNESIVLRSDGVSGYYIFSDNRASVGQSKNFMLLTGATVIVSGNGVALPFTAVQASYGASIAQNGNGCLLKSGKTFKLTASISIVNTGGAQAAIRFFNSTANSVITTVSGNNAIVFSTNGSQPYSNAGPLVAYFTPTVDSVVVVQSANTAGNTDVSLDRFEIEEISSPANVADEKSYLKVNANNQQIVSTGTTINFQATPEMAKGGKFTYNGSNSITVAAGAYVELVGIIPTTFLNSGWYRYYWFNGSINVGNAGQCEAGNIGATAVAVAAVNPQTATTYRLVVTASSGTFILNDNASTGAYATMIAREI